MTVNPSFKIAFNSVVCRVEIKNCPEDQQVFSKEQKDKFTELIKSTLGANIPRTLSLSYKDLKDDSKEAIERLRSSILIQESRVDTTTGIRVNDTIYTVIIKNVPERLQHEILNLKTALGEKISNTLNQAPTQLVLSYEDIKCLGKEIPSDLEIKRLERAIRSNVEIQRNEVNIAGRSFVVKAFPPGTYHPQAQIERWKDDVELTTDAILHEIEIRTNTNAPSQYNWSSPKGLELRKHQYIAEATIKYLYVDFIITTNKTTDLKEIESAYAEFLAKASMVLLKFSTSEVIGFKRPIFDRDDIWSNPIKALMTVKYRYASMQNKNYVNIFTENDRQYFSLATPLTFIPLPTGWAVPEEFYVLENNKYKSHVTPHFNLKKIPEGLSKLTPKLAGYKESYMKNKTPLPTANKLAKSLCAQFKKHHKLVRDRESKHLNSLFTKKEPPSKKVPFENHTVFSSQLSYLDHDPRFNTKTRKTLTKIGEDLLELPRKDKHSEVYNSSWEKDTLVVQTGQLNGTALTPLIEIFSGLGRYGITQSTKKDASGKTITEFAVDISLLEESWLAAKEEISIRLNKGLNGVILIQLLQGIVSEANRIGSQAHFNMLQEMAESMETIKEDDPFGEIVTFDASLYTLRIYR